MGFNLQLGDVLRSGSVTAIDDAIREIVRQEIARTPRTKFCDACAYMHQPDISARCCCVACHGDDVPAWAQRMNTPLSSEKTGDASPASEVKACPECGHTAEHLSSWISPRKDIPERLRFTCFEEGCQCSRLAAPAPVPFGSLGNDVEETLDALLGFGRSERMVERAQLRNEIAGLLARRTPAPSPATGESAIEGILDDEACRARSASLDVVRVKLVQRVEAARAELASLRAEVERLRKPPSADPHIKRGSYGEPSVEELVQVYIRAYNNKCTALLHKIDALDSDAQAGIAAVRAAMIGANLRPYEGALNEIREAIDSCSDATKLRAEGARLCVLTRNAVGDEPDEHARACYSFATNVGLFLDSLRTALAEKEKAGVDANSVVERCIELVVKKKTPSWDEVSVWCDALRTALGAKERGDG